MARGRTQSQKELKETKAISVSSDPIPLRHCVFDGPFLPLNHEGMCVCACMCMCATCRAYAGPCIREIKCLAHSFSVDTYVL
jgi:hypothetical protein